MKVMSENSKEKKPLKNSVASKNIPEHFII